MKVAQGAIIQAVYELLNDKIYSGDAAQPYTLSYIKRVTDDGGSIELSTCFSDNTAFTSYIPVFSSQTPTFKADAYIFIYGLQSQEVGPVDSFIHDNIISVKCALSIDGGSISADDLNDFGNTVANIMQPTTFSQITVTGFAVVDQQLQNVNYVLPQISDSRYEWSVTLDWLLRVEEI